MEDNESTPLFCWTVLHPYHEGAIFDFDLYAKALIPEYIDILGENCLRYEIHKGLAAPGAPAAHFLCMTHIWIKNREQFRAAMSDPRMVATLKKIAASTDIQPLRQLDEVIA